MYHVECQLDLRNNYQIAERKQATITRAFAMLANDYISKQLIGTTFHITTEERTVGTEWFYRVNATIPE